MTVVGLLVGLDILCSVQLAKVNIKALFHSLQKSIRKLAASACIKLT
jgi:hypothetical protein